MQELRNHSKHPARYPVSLILILVGLMIIATPVLEPTVLAQTPVTTPSWAFTGSLSTDRQGHTATLLKNGKVLVAAGIGAGFLSSAELYDPATGGWNYSGSLRMPRYFCTATLLTDGRVLVVGGFTDNNPPDFGITNTAELYDPGSGTWSPTGNLTSNRAWHTATLLRSGKVLVAGGTGAANDIITNMAELWDPVTGAWTTTGSLTTARYAHTATLLQDGSVLIAGGSDDGDFFTTLASVELYDPGAGTWTSGARLGTGRILHTATLLPGGKVLVSGGYARDGGPPTSLSSTELYDPATRNWSYTGTLNGARDSHTATLLTNGQVLVAGGFDWNRRVNLTSAELYDLSSGSWTIAADLNTARDNHTATLLPSGKVLVAGGRNISGTLDSAELYAVPVSNQIDEAQSFVRQHYRDFLNREPDAPGLDFWTDNITKCSDPARRPAAQTEAECIGEQRVTTSAAFFLSPEFQYTGYFVYRLYKGSLILNGAGRSPTYQEFLRDVRQVASGIIQNNQLSAAAIEENKKRFAEEFTRQTEFRSLYDPLSNFDYVERLFQTTGINVSAPEKQALVEGLDRQTETRASVLQKVVDGAVVIAEGNQQFTTVYGRAFYQNEFNEAFVLMEYFGYLQRDPDAPGYQHWLDKLNFYGNYMEAEMVRSFIVSPEYRARFGPP